MATLELIMQLQVQYKAWLRERIKRMTQEFVERVLPKYGPQRVYSKKWDRSGLLMRDVNINEHWCYEIWCQDETLCAWDEFLDEVRQEEPDADALDDKPQERLNAIFDEVFRSLAKELRLDVRVLEE